MAARIMVQRERSGMTTKSGDVENGQNTRPLDSYRDWGSCAVNILTSRYQCGDK